MKFPHTILKFTVLPLTLGTEAMACLMVHSMLLGTDTGTAVGTGTDTSSMPAMAYISGSYRQFFLDDGGAAVGGAPVGGAAVGGAAVGGAAIGGAAVGGDVAH